MEFKGTKGEWVLRTSNKGAYNHVDAYNWSGLARVIRKVDGKKNAEGIANAKLIAAAPDLLAALRKISLEYAQSQYFINGGYKEQQVWFQAQVAIAKALGK